MPRAKTLDIHKHIASFFFVIGTILLYRELQVPIAGRRTVVAKALLTVGQAVSLQLQAQLQVLVGLATASIRQRKAGLSNATEMLTVSTATTKITIIKERDAVRLRRAAVEVLNQAGLAEQDLLGQLQPRLRPRFLEQIPVIRTESAGQQRHVIQLMAQ